MIFLRLNRAPGGIQGSLIIPTFKSCQHRSVKSYQRRNIRSYRQNKTGNKGRGCLVRSEGRLDYCDCTQSFGHGAKPFEIFSLTVTWHHHRTTFAVNVTAAKRIGEATHCLVTDHIPYLHNLRLSGV